MQITIKAARVNASMTQAQIAEKMGVSVSAVSLWESYRNDMSARQFAQFCDIVGVNRDDIFLPTELT